ncbi:Protein CBG28037 [Caenorhabditis briggsae]|uniref:Protein CBG28037 n=1 Tax=Caenorhabditis briggsae TaxID=6238 RepID=B6IGM7_CAEBR|nr:Protein CBG28037 [Caenorhabditis briggsae]CAR99057.1 Protein CBG28037 [Caenorhabditis briggsae]
MDDNPRVYILPRIQKPVDFPYPYYCSCNRRKPLCHICSPLLNLRISSKTKTTTESLILNNRNVYQPTDVPLISAFHVGGIINPS